MKKFDINLNLYRSFYYVAKFGGFTVASKKMMVSQPALSANIKNLEDILGVQLIDRKIGKIALTNNGRELFLKLEEIIYKADKLSRQCFNCKAEKECYWSSEKKNFKITY